MSKILRRPMFRKGGSISSDGVGITSGLHDNRERYADPTDKPVGDNSTEGITLNDTYSVSGELC